MDDPKKDWLLSAFSHAQKRRYFLPHAAVVLLEILAVFVLYRNGVGGSAGGLDAFR